MPVLIATPKAVDANSYLTVAEANALLGRRLYSAKWDNAAKTPNAEGYSLTADVASGASSVSIGAGTGTFTKGCVFTIADYETEYTVADALTGAGTLTFTPALVDNVTDGDAINRVTANDREKAIMWSTSLLDSLISWKGYKTTTAQALRWPRGYTTDEDGYPYNVDNIPRVIKVATAEYALILLTRDVFKTPAALGQGVSEVSLGVLKAVIDPEQQLTIVPDNILAMLGGLGTLDADAQVGSTVVRLLRV